jgi:hypothetical protein
MFPFNFSKATSRSMRSPGPGFSSKALMAASIPSAAAVISTKGGIGVGKDRFPVSFAIVLRAFTNNPDGVIRSNPNFTM